MSDDIVMLYNSVGDQLANPQDPVLDSECERTESAEEESPTCDPIIEDPTNIRYGLGITGTATPPHTPEAPLLPVSDHQMEPSDSCSEGDLGHDPPIEPDSEMSHDDVLEQLESDSDSAGLSSGSKPYEAGATKRRKLEWCWADRLITCNETC